MASQVDAFRNLHTINGDLQSAHNVVLTNAAQALNQIVVYKADWWKLWSPPVTQLRYAYLLTGDEQYATPAKDFALQTAQDPDAISGYNISRCRAYVNELARCYDTFYDLMTAEERSTLADFIRQKGNALLADIQSAYTIQIAPHRDMACAYLIMGAAAMLGEFAEAQTWLDFCIQHFTGTIDGYPWPYMSGGNDGGWGDGVYYWSYGWMIRSEAFQTITQLGLADLLSVPSIRNAGMFPLYLCPPKTKFVGTYGDGGTSAGFTSPGKEMRLNLLRMSLAYQDPYYRWFAEQKNLFNEPADPNPYNRLYMPGNDPIYLLRLALDEIAAPVTAASPSGLPQARWFEGSGYVSLHTDLGSPETNMALNLRCAPYPVGTTNHAHPDQNSIVLYYHKEPLIMNSGYYGGGVGGPGAYTPLVIHNSKSKNVILVNGEGQHGARQTAEGHVLAFEPGGNYDYVVGEVSAAYNALVPNSVNKFARHIAFVRGAADPYLIVVDDIALPASSQVDWLLHTGGQPSIDESGQSMTLNVGNSHAFVQLICEKPLNISSTNQTDPPWQPDIAAGGEQWHVTCTPTSNVTNIQIAAVVIPYAGENPGSLPAPITGSKTGSTYTVSVGGEEFAFDLANNSLSSSM